MAVARALHHWKLEHDLWMHDAKCPENGERGISEYICRKHPLKMDAGGRAEHSHAWMPFGPKRISQIPGFEEALGIDS